MDELDYQERREQALLKSEDASAILDQFAHGPASAVITTRSGPLHTLAHFEQKVQEVVTDVDSTVIDLANLLDTLP